MPMKSMALVAASVLLLGCTGCSLSSGASQASGQAESIHSQVNPLPEDSSITLVNRMTKAERERTALTVFIAEEWDHAAQFLLKRSLRLLRIYDEELGMEFTARIILPPGYDPRKKYPVMLDTDGIWRTGLVPQAPLQEHAPTILRDDGSNGVYYHMDDLWQLTSALSLRELMDGTNYEPVILVSLGFSRYPVEWQTERAKMQTILEKREALLHFITDNLMPRLGQEFPLCYERSTLCGYGTGALFSHYALFQADQYENQPFGGYLIADPTFQVYSQLKHDPAPDAWKSDFGCAQSHMDKFVMLRYSTRMPEDLASSQNADSDPDPIQQLTQRLVELSAPGSFEPIEGHYGSDVSGVLLEFLKEYYAI